MKKIFFLFLALLTSVGALFSQKILIGDLYYSLNNSDKTAHVTDPPNNAKYELIDVSIPHSVTCGGTVYTVSEIGSCAFDHCDMLKSINIPYSIRKIGFRAFDFCKGLTSVTIPNSVTSIGKEAFSYCYGLTSIEIPNSVTNIGESAFSSCISLTSVTIPNSVTSMGKFVFSGCSMDEINFKGTVEQWISKSWKTSEIFWDYKGNGYTLLMNGEIVKNVTFPGTITAIEAGLFYYCKSLISVTIPNSVTSIGQWAFYCCTSLTSVTIPNSVTSIEPYAFAYVANIAYSGSATGSPWSAKSINGYVDGCLVYNNSLKTELWACSSVATGRMIIPKSVTKIGTNAFAMCSNLTSAIIPSSVSSIENYAFGRCVGLNSIYVGSGVESIGDNAFYKCDSLAEITCFAVNPPTTSNRTFDELNCSNICLYVPEESITAYMYADGWKVFNPILPIQISEDDLEEGIDSVTEVKATSRKILRDGQIIIQNGKNEYTMTGKRL